MTGRRRTAVCGVLALLPAGLTLGALLRPALQVPADTRHPDVMLVRVMPGPGHLTKRTDPRKTIDAAQPSVPNSGKHADQNREQADTQAPAADNEAIGGYLPVSRLTEWPRLDEHAPSPSPAVPPIGPHADGPRLFDAVLLINEHGDVDQVALPEPSLSAAQQRQLQEYFLALRFVPGRLFGRPVRSRLRIEIRLDHGGAR